MNPDLQRERANSTFDVEKITHMLDGGKSRTERRRHLEAIIERDPTGVFSNESNHYLHRTERHVRGIAKGVRMIELCRRLGIGDECNGQIIESEDFQVFLEALGDDTPLGEFENALAPFVVGYPLMRFLLLRSTSLGHVSTEHCQLV
jgi:acyl-CoA oxidase